MHPQDELGRWYVIQIHCERGLTQELGPAIASNASTSWNDAPQGNPGKSAAWTNPPEAQMTAWNGASQNGHVLTEPSMHVDTSPKTAIGIGSDVNCRNCGIEGHFSRDCPEPRKALGACFNCGQDGYAIFFEVPNHLTMLVAIQNQSVQIHVSSLAPAISALRKVTLLLSAPISLPRSARIAAKKVRSYR